VFIPAILVFQMMAEARKTACFKLLVTAFYIYPHCSQAIYVDGLLGDGLASIE